MILFIDFETTGLTSPSPDWLAQPGIVQIGALRIGELIDLDDGDMPPDESFYVNVNPEGVKWHDDAIKTHGITPESVAAAPTFFEIGPALASFALGCRAWAGYNTKFDRDVLWHQLCRYGLERNFPWPPDEIDVMKLAAREMEMQGKRGMKRPKLGEAYEFFLGKPLQGAHDALADIRATVDIWRALQR